ncbi:PDZ domain-containing protein [Peribacillus saganii]|uniref:C-terminal processing peptidase n=1 Tax=Peribacillus saganii TaxID=2303992 RepID=A0A372LNW3_9BACI|nr:S41 family peptidase [Peribacillus saganii]RFU69359.1 PDZ domain-containing protein [Peribacillus saganii]
MRRKWVLPAVAAVTLTAGVTGGMYLGSSEDGPLKKWIGKMETDGEVDKQEKAAVNDKELGKVEQAYDLILSSYVEEVESDQLVEGAIQGMLTTLDDPYSVYMDKETAKQFEETLDSSFEGIGTEIGIDEGKIIIISPYKNSPAEKAGLKPKDQILKVNGESVEGKNLYETRLKIRGKKGTSVTLEIKRDGVANPIIVKMVRAEIPLESVFSAVKEEKGKKMGYIELTTFSVNTAADFKNHLQKLEEQNIQGLIIDVRGNPGGLLSSVEEIVGNLVTNKKPYLQIEERNGDTRAYFTNLKEKKEYPIAVLMDKGSASASEILASALQEAGGYPLIGDRSFGKGTVQQPVPMGDGSNIKLTLFKWLSPDGNWIHKKGIEPTIEVHQPDYFNLQPLAIDKTLKRDDNSEQIKHAQEMLSGLGFESSRDDGYFDQRTEVAVKAFQQQNGIEVTGKLDQKTAGAIETALIEKIKDEQNDIQLKIALKYLAK